MDVLTFNGKPFSDFETFFDGSQMFVTPEKDVSFFTIPGKNGDLSISNDRYNNKNVNVNCFIRSDFRKNFSGLMNYLLSQEGYKRFESSKEPDVFMLAQFVNTVEPTTGAFLKFGNFTLTFNFKPQKWLKTGENPIAITNSATVYNPSLMSAKPLLKVRGTGDIIINGKTLTLSRNTSTTYIDFEIQDAYEGTINRNSDLIVNDGFPDLVPGENTISVNGCTIELIPRWWRL